jgi:two-component system, chemotaxis family, protein-glutamate methylesterase/glutaminase
VEKVRALGRARQRKDLSPAPVVAPVRAVAVRQVSQAGRSPPTVIAIGSSTGGPQALVTVIENLRDIRQPVLITQHMPAMFTAMLADQLARVGGRPCAEGKDGEPIVDGRSYVAPGGYHMIVEGEGKDRRIRVNQDPPENFCRPAVDPLFRSVAASYGSNALGVVLTGMGSDGAKGCEAIAAGQGRFIVQDEASSVVWGMPGAAARTGLAEEILPLPQIGPWLRRVAGGGA